MPSPSTDWCWWGAKAQVKGSIKKSAGSVFSLTFYLCAECRRQAWQQARESVSYLPKWLWTSGSVDGYFQVNRESLAKHAACKVLHQEMGDLAIDSVWVAED